MNEAVVRRRVVVHGLVQGVFFRASVRDTARRLDLSGTVRNRPDGTVEAIFEGPNADVVAAVDFCRSGPRAAVVDQIEISDEPPCGDVGFRVV